MRFLHSRFLCLVFMLFISLSNMGAVSKADFVIDVTGLEAFGELGDPGNTVRLYAMQPSADISKIAWEGVRIEAIDPSWLSEVFFVFSNSDESASWAFGLTALQDSGIYVGSGTNLDFVESVGGAFSLLDDGVLRIEMFETFADAGLTPNSRALSGTFAISTVPEPSSALLITTLGIASLRWIHLRKVLHRRRN